MKRSELIKDLGELATACNGPGEHDLAFYRIRDAIRAIRNRIEKEGISGGMTTAECPGVEVIAHRYCDRIDATVHAPVERCGDGFLLGLVEDALTRVVNAENGATVDIYLP